MEWAVDNRYMNGTKTMVIDLESCVRCDDCVRACAATHGGNPRFRREGDPFGKWMVSNACMHCKDPVCMVGCPTGAIHRDQSTGTVVINDVTCVGCGTCANACPYDNIVMVPIRDSAGTAIVDSGGSGAPIVKATKCDLCAGRPGGPACVQACPTNALQRVDFVISTPRQVVDRLRAHPAIVDIRGAVRVRLLGGMVLVGAGRGWPRESELEHRLDSAREHPAACRVQLAQAAGCVRPGSGVDMAVSPRRGGTGGGCSLSHSYGRCLADGSL